jgi:DNA-binding response OmpR family regulator
MSITPPTVLIAEDNPGLARVLSFKFKSSGFTPIVCADGQLAWEAFQSNSVLAIVSDQEMPRMSGIDLCRNVRTQNLNIPFFLVTGRQLELASTGITEELNISKIFGKPFSPGEVITAVNDAIQASPASR